MPEWQGTSCGSEKRAQAASCAKEKDNKGKEQLTTYRLKQWRTFKVQGVKRKRGASSGPTTGVGSIF